MTNCTQLLPTSRLARSRRVVASSPVASLLLVLLPPLSARPSQAQEVSIHQFTDTSSTLVPVMEGNTPSNLAQNGAISANSPLSFTFYYGDNAITTVQATSGGCLDLNGGAGSRPVGGGQGSPRGLALL